MTLPAYLVTALLSFASAALLSSVLSILKLTFQHGGTLEKLSSLIEAVQALTSRMEELSERHGDRLSAHDRAFARLEERVLNVVERITNLESVNAHAVRMDHGER